ncbi:MAG TPA: serine/threonine-protein kinase [Vicinamibacterales bacterium]|nr:serine/threonine-protein kinase [Vicinamibacterales bacterium]
MPACPGCAADLPLTLDLCPHCSTPLPWHAEETRLAVPAAPRAASVTSSSGWLSTTDALDQGRFPAGTMLAARYRVVGRLGRGGMGEVYRADDLKLGQPVALKFLPESVDRDPARLAQLHAEVRTARQVSHPNVCRVYDIDEIDGHAFLSMEYVDGEDLASLLRRIGRFSQERALELARQICAGLAAAHDRGVVHRDLKPANVMLDGAGRIRITDFGLAGLSGEVLRAGTPAYMAPEQLAGGEVTARSDIYALGLVLYELFTGQRANQGRNVAEVAAQHEHSTITPPSTLVRELDPAIERAIFRCLERDPARRPASALAVAAALPGGDPLAAALAAGETPSPELLIAAGETTAMPVARAITLALLAFAGIGVFAVLSVRGSIPALVPLGKPPAVLIDRIQQMTAAFGYTDAPADTASGFTIPPDYPRWLRDRSPQRRWWDALRTTRPPALVFWYRTSPRPLIPDDSSRALVTSGDPAFDVSGMRTVITDTDGRLVEFHAVPPQMDSSGAGGAPSWQALFDAAGLDMRTFHAVAPEWTPRAYADTRQAWEGPLGAGTDVTVRVEAAAYKGRPTSFFIVGPWARPSRMQPLSQSRIEFAAGVLSLFMWIAMMSGAALLARRHVRAGRADWRGATRLATALFAGFIVSWLAVAHHTAIPQDELQRFITALGLTAFNAAQVWVLYVAIEPYARRFWPDGLLGWSRLMSGRVRDSRVGHDLLLGALLGAALLLAELGRAIVPLLFGARPMLPPFGDRVASLGRLAALPDSWMQSLYNGLQSALLIALLFVVMRLIVRRSWLAVTLVVALLMLLSNNGRFVSGGWTDFMFGLAVVAILSITVFRFGLLTLAVAIFVDGIVSTVPLSPSPSAWWAMPGNIALLMVAGLIAFGFYAARTGEPLFGREVFD